MNDIPIPLPLPLPLAGRKDLLKTASLEGGVVVVIVVVVLILNVRIV